MWFGSRFEKLGNLNTFFLDVFTEHLKLLTVNWYFSLLVTGGLDGRNKVML